MLRVKIYDECERDGEPGSGSSHELYDMPLNDRRIAGTLVIVLVIMAMLPRDVLLGIAAILFVYGTMDLWVNRFEELLKHIFAGERRD